MDENLLVKENIYQKIFKMLRHCRPKHFYEICNGNNSVRGYLNLPINNPKTKAHAKFED